MTDEELEDSTASSCMYCLLDTPKSDSLTCMSVVSSMLAHFTSLMHETGLVQML